MKARVKEEWVCKEEFSCIKCGRENTVGWNDKGSNHPLTEPEGVLFCKRCGHELTTKEELEDLVYSIEVLQFGFFIRFIHDHFIPCGKCQGELEKILMGKIKQWEIDEPLRVELDYFGPKWRFRFPWIRTGQDAKDVNVVILCKKCSDVLEEGIINAKELHIGNKDLEPPIEVWRKWITDDKRTERIYETLKSTLDRLKKAYMNPNWKKAMEQKIIETLMTCKTTKMVDDYLSKLEKMVF